VRVEHGTKILERLGYDRPPPRDGDRAWGFYPGGDGEGKSGEELFWFRRGPERLVPEHYLAVFYPRVDFAGQTIRVRFRFDSVDEEFNDPTGWLVDDVSVTGECAGGSDDEIFADGFESGDVGGWS
jgi:hypothetical protein